jgi:transcriptional regulator with XRE-family HTH domain
MSNYRKAQRRVQVTSGESVKIIRELQELSQNDLSQITKIPQSTISAIERDRINLGVERAKVLARALRCHPAVLVFPGWDIANETAA